MISYARAHKHADRQSAAIPLPSHSTDFSRAHGVQVVLEEVSVRGLDPCQCDRRDPGTSGAFRRGRGSASVRLGAQAVPWEESGGSVAVGAGFEGAAGNGRCGDRVGAFRETPPMPRWEALTSCANAHGADPRGKTFGW